MTFEEAKKLADLNRMPYFETSAKTNKNVKELIESMMESVYKKQLSSETGSQRDTNAVQIR